jgi:hypothetical protein
MGGAVRTTNAVRSVARHKWSIGVVRQAGVCTRTARRVMRVSSFSAGADLRELRRAVSCEPLERLPFQIRGSHRPCPARTDTQRFMRLSWWRAVIWDCVRTSDVQDGCGYPRGPRCFTIEARLTADPRSATLGGARCSGEARRHQLSVDFPSQFTRALALAPLAAGSGVLRYTEWRWIKQSHTPVLPAGPNTRSCASKRRR